MPARFGLDDVDLIRQNAQVSDMKSNSPVKIIVGVFTSWIVISPFLLVAFWFLFVLTIATIAENQVQSGSGSDLVILFAM